MPVTITKNLSPEMQAVADARQLVRNAESAVDECKTKLKEAKAAWELAVEELNRAIDLAIDAERQPSLFDGLAGDRGDDDGEPGKPAPRDVETEPADRDDFGSDAAPVAALPAPAPIDPTAPRRADFPRDRTGEVEWMLAVARHRGDAGPEEERVGQQIAAYREDQNERGHSITPGWGSWSEFEVVTDVAGSSPQFHRITVLYHPDHGNNAGHDLFGFWGDPGSISADGHVEHVETWGKAAGGRIKRPQVTTLEEWAREFAQGKAEEYARERKATGGGGAGGGGRKKAPAGMEGL